MGEETEDTIYEIVNQIPITEENREQTLKDLLNIAHTKYGVNPKFTVQLIVVCGILQ